MTPRIPSEPTVRNTVDLLQEISAAMETMLLQFGDRMSPHDRRARGTLVDRAEALAREMALQIETEAGGQSAAHHRPSYDEASVSCLGIPLSCGKPLCSPASHHPLCAKSR